MKHAGGRGFGKLLLFGEHAAVYGHPAVGLSLTDATRVELSLAGAQWRFRGVSPDQSDNLRRLLLSFEEIVPALSGFRGGELSVASSIPSGLGFGSSAALCTALASALFELFGRDAKPADLEEEHRRIWAWAHAAEGLFHGTPSGIDTGLSLLNGLYSFAPDPPRLPVARRLRGFPLSLVIGAVPRRAGSAALIRSIRERMEAGDRDTVRTLGSLGEISRRAEALLEGEDGLRAAKLGALATEAMGELVRLGLSTPELNALIRKGCELGALGGKLSGAGGGGAFFLILPDRKSAQIAARRLRSEARRMGLPTWRIIRALTWREVSGLGPLRMGS